MLGGITKALDKAVDIVKDPVGTITDIAKGSLDDIVKTVIGELGGNLLGGPLFGTAKSLGDLLDMLRGTGLGSNLDLNGVLDGRETSIPLDSGRSGLPPHLADCQPLVDGFARCVTADPKLADLFSDKLGGALSGSKTPAELTENLKRLSERLGMPPSVIAMLLQAMQESGMIKNPSAMMAPADTGAQAPVGATAAPGAAAAGGGAPSPKTPLGGTIDGAGGFLYKPFSDSDGKLVVLTPESVAGQVASVVVRGPDGAVLAEGRFTGNGNGGRDHFRFDRAGSAFPPNVSVEVRLKNGASTSHVIGNPALRYD